VSDSAIPTTFDVIIIGSGPGGYVAAIRAGQLGLATAIVEKDPFLGGTCLHRGCIPTKALLHTADVLDEIREAKSIGISVGAPELDPRGVQAYKRKVVTKLSKGVEFLMKKNLVTVFTGFGRLEGPRSVAVSGADGSTTTLTARRGIVLATGSVPRSIPGIEIDGVSVINSDHLLELDSVPKSLAVLGAGAVGVEFASVFSRFGTKVTILELLPRLVPIEDPDVSAELATGLKRRKIAFHTGTKVQGVEKRGDGGLTITAVDEKGEPLSLEAEKLLVAVGRGPVTSGIGLEAVGVATDRGYVKVDALMRTSVPGIFAIGDIVPTPWLAHVASQEGIVAVEQLAGHPTRPINYDRIPGCTYCDPEIGSVGLTEPKARERGHDVAIGKFPLPPLGKVQILGAREGFIKIVAEKKYGEILGVHIVGPHATELIAEGCAALASEMTVEELVHTIHAHPTVSEGMKEAAEAVFGLAIHGA
jgi:dihydrolipoamide dehydrogenase